MKKEDVATPVMKANGPKEKAEKSPEIQETAKETGTDQGTDEAKPENKIPERLTISGKLLNDMLGILSILPAYQIMELITKVQMDLTMSPSKEELEKYFKAKK